MISNASAGQIHGNLNLHKLFNWLNELTQKTAESITKATINNKPILNGRWSRTNNRKHVK